VPGGGISGGTPFKGRPLQSSPKKCLMGRGSMAKGGKGGEKVRRISERKGAYIKKRDFLSQSLQNLLIRGRKKSTTTEGEEKNKRGVEGKER